jgi:hypothetical protein
MKNIPGITLLSVLMLVTSGAAEAQATHKVWVDDNDAQNKDVANALRAKIGSTTRYGLADKVYETEIDLKVVCIANTLGYACSYAVSFWSPKTSPMQIHGASGVTIGPTAQETAELVFESFVQGTTDDTIENAVKNELALISMFCKAATNQQYCQPQKP